MNIKDSTGRTALHYAAHKNYIKVVRILLENGCDINIRDIWETTALLWAEQYNNKDVADAIKAFTVKNPSQSPLPVNCRTSSTTTASNVPPSTPEQRTETQRMRTTTPTQQPPRRVAGKGEEQLLEQIEQLKNESSEKDREIAEMRKQNADLQTALRVDAKVEEKANDDNIASDKKDDVRRQRFVLLVVLLCVGTVLLAVVLQRIIYTTDCSIDTSLREPTRIREKAAVPLATDSDDDQVTSVELLKIAVEAGSHWHSFGIHLGFSGETLRQYEKQFHEASRLLFEILDNWRKQKGKQATKNAVLEACRQACVRGACERVFIR
ncbi:uncharacterized protein LOC134198454 [Corticium candelabrum]|uniref:uncharacterized protein LOC134198454 n=1 Tax=Corticium candelabrum TaxID=121492 RepID=UPI002E263F9B|nr:uncharacterized protein LOC134198454 [Corticium candelabrum]